eukprot:scaffold5893_cov106-Skeletonema_marinoi.AAC.7
MTKIFEYNITLAAYVLRITATTALMKMVTSYCTSAARASEIIAHHVRQRMHAVLVTPFCVRIAYLILLVRNDIVNVICNECLLSNKCGECNKRWCITCSDCLQCENCLVERCCAECSEKEGVNGVHECYDNYCRSTLCDKCRMKQCQSGESNCKECVNMISSVLLAETKKLQEEVKSLRDRNKLMVMGDEMQGLKEEMRVLE